MLKNAKVILAAIAILIAAVVVWALVGVIVTIVKLLLLLAVILFGVSINPNLANSTRTTPTENSRKPCDSWKRSSASS